MLSEAARITILELSRKGLSIRRIAKALSISRGAVRDVLQLGSAKAPKLVRPEKADAFRDQIRELYVSLKGNLVRVHEEILGEGCEISYPALTSFCRRQGIGVKEKPPAGRYHFDPGQEMQHDTSPHKIKIGGHLRLVQVASLVLCYSRILYFQYFPTFKRFDCKVFLTDALRAVGGSCQTCMIDNTHVIVLKGSGTTMVPVPEMKAFADHFGFSFVAHEKGDANRSARVERPFHYIENNFENGRSGEDFKDWNRQAVAWCDQLNARFRRHLKASARELFAAERPKLTPLPDWIPEVYRLLHRTVSTDGYIRVDTNLYSAPLAVGKPVEVRETKDRIDLYDGPRLVATHQRVAEPSARRVTNPAHRPPRGQGKKARQAKEEATLERLAPELSAYVAALQTRGRGPAVTLLRKLLSMVREYPRAPLLAALKEALHYGLFDLERVERMVLRRIKEDFFYLTGDEQGEHDGS